MLQSDENLKDTQANPQKDSLSMHNLASHSTGLATLNSSSYSKANKLITALYMVTDVIDKDEPIRGKLRKAGAEIISDIHSVPANAINKISETIAFLDIAATMNLISEMNRNILKKEFIDLNNRIEKYSIVKPNWLEEFLVNPPASLDENSRISYPLNNSTNNSNGHSRFEIMNPSTRIGVQKGSTLMQALSDKALLRTLGNNSTVVKNQPTTSSASSNNFDLLKKQRREDIIRIVKGNDSGLTITDIKAKAKEQPKPALSLTSCSEKTLQRELVSMVKDNLLNKTGEKRWSRYFLKK